MKQCETLNGHPRHALCLKSFLAWQDVGHRQHLRIATLPNHDTPARRRDLAFRSADAGHRNSQEISLFRRGCRRVGSRRIHVGPADHGFDRHVGMDLVLRMARGAARHAWMRGRSGGDSPAGPKRVPRMGALLRGLRHKCSSGDVFWADGGVRGCLAGRWRHLRPWLRHLAASRFPRLLRACGRMLQPLFTGRRRDRVGADWRRGGGPGGCSSPWGPFVWRRAWSS